jgi:Peptidase family S41/Tricorn protease C1 domain
MRSWLFIILLLLVSFSCNDLFLGKDPGNSAVDTFEELWQGVNLTWPAFESKRVNWDSLYAVYRPQVNSSTSNSDLTKVLNALISKLNDAHTNVYPKNAASFPSDPKYPSFFYGISWIKNNYIKNFKGNNSIAYGLINSSIGYIYIGTFFNSSNQYEIIDTILKEFADVKGIIIDVRGNGGGSSSNSEIIASRFVVQNRVYAFSKWRVDRQKNNLSDFYSAEISPAGSNQFKNKVAILSNRYSFSATEDFLLMMKSQSQVMVLGDNTGGGSESRPIMKELPNGWTYRVSSKLIYDANKELISKGIEPHLKVQTTKADSLNGKDSIIERAIVELMKP